jgi:hypothetical protein
MTDKPTDSTVVLPDVGGSPKPPEGSAEQGGERGSAALQFDQDTVTRIADLVSDRVSDRVVGQVREKLAPDIERGIQTSKDRRFKDLEGISGESLRLVADLIKRNEGNLDKVEQDLAIQSFLEERRSQAAVSSDPSASQARPSSEPDKGMSEPDLKVAARSVLEKFNLDEAAEKAVRDQWAKMQFDSSRDAELGLIELAVKAGRGEPVSAAGFVAPEVGTSVPSQDSEAMLVEKDRLYTQLHELFKEPSANKAEIASTKESLRKLGEEI